MVTKEQTEVKKNDARVAVVMELPTQTYNQVTTEEGEIVNMITLLQAVTEMYNDIKQIKEAVAD